MYGYKYFNNEYKSFYNLENLEYPENGVYSSLRKPSSL